MQTFEQVFSKVRSSSKQSVSFYQNRSKISFKCPFFTFIFKIAHCGFIIDKLSAMRKQELLISCQIIIWKAQGVPQ